MNKITLIGCGKMGSAIATRIIQAHFPLTVYNRTPDKMQPLIQLGAKGAHSLSEAVNDADVVITCLLDDASMLNITNGEEGILKHLKTNAIHIATATILPSTTEKLHKLHQQQGIYYIAANVLGVPSVALAGKLTTFVAGDPKIIEQCQKILSTFSANIINLGANPKHANVVKISMNYALMTAIELISELYSYAEKNEIDLNIIQECLHNIYAHPAIKLYIEKIKDRNFDQVNFDMRSGAKDVNVFQKAFSEAGVAPELAYIAHSRLMTGLAQGMENKDWSAIYEIVRAQAGLK